MIQIQCYYISPFLLIIHSFCHILGTISCTNSTILLKSSDRPENKLINGSSEVKEKNISIKTESFSK
jgi:hypothetical protein